MNKRCIQIFFVFFLTLVLIGCATIIHGGRQNVPVTSSPSGATVTVNRIKVETPGVINLSRSDPLVVLRFEKEGYEPVEITLTRTTDGWVWGNILIGGIIGVAIDFSTGAAYQLSPKQVNVTLRSLGYKETAMEGAEKEPKIDKVVAIDMLSRPSKYSEYYRYLNKTISNKIDNPQRTPGGVVNIGVVILSDGTLESVQVLDSSSQEAVLREAVVKAVNDCAPFPPFPDDIKEGRKAFSLSFDFKFNK